MSQETEWIECVDCANRYPYSENRWAGLRHCEGCGSDAYFRVDGPLTQYEILQREDQPHPADREYMKGGSGFPETGEGG